MSDEQLISMLVGRARSDGLQLTGVDEMVLSLSVKGLTHGEISAHLAEIYGAEVSRQTISGIADAVMEGVTEWQARLLDRVYPVVFVDAINVKIRDDKVANQLIYAAWRHRRGRPRHPSVSEPVTVGRAPSTGFRSSPSSRIGA